MEERGRELEKIRRDMKHRKGGKGRETKTKIYLFFRGVKMKVRMGEGGGERMCKGYSMRSIQKLYGNKRITFLL